MKLPKIFSLGIALILITFASPVFADKIGVVFDGDSALQMAIIDSLKGDGHEVVDISNLLKDNKLDAVAAASIGKQSGVEVIVSGRKVGPSIVIKILSTKNDAVQGGVPASDGDVPGMVKELIAKVKNTR